MEELLKDKNYPSPLFPYPRNQLIHENHYQPSSTSNQGEGVMEEEQLESNTVVIVAHRFILYTSNM